MKLFPITDKTKERARDEKFSSKRFCGFCSKITLFCSEFFTMNIIADEISPKRLFFVGILTKFRQ